jgi:hypothetical protein
MALWWIQADTRANSNTAHTHPSVRVVSRPGGRKSIEGGRKNIQGASHSSSLDALGREEEHPESIPLSLPRCSSEEEHRGREEEYPGSISFSLPRCSSSLLQVVSRPAEACHRLATHKKINTHYLPAWIIGCRRFAASDIGSLWLPLCQVYIATHTHTHTHTHARTHTHTHTHKHFVILMLVTSGCLC